MKFFGVALAAAALAQNNTARAGVAMTGPSCFHCNGESWEACLTQAYQKGGQVTCREDKMCSMFERRRGGKIEQVEMRCKQKSICYRKMFLV